MSDINNINIRQIIRQAGYDVLEERVTGECTSGWRHEFDLRFNVETRKYKLANPNAEYENANYEFVNGVHTVFVKTVGFNGHGDLYIILSYMNGWTFTIIEKEYPD